MKTKISRLDPHQLADGIPRPSTDADKYTRGKLTIVGGCADYPGSVCLAGPAAMRMGAGYVECACAAEAVPLVRASMPSLVVREWDPAGSALDLASDERHPKACLIGSGMFDDKAVQRTLVMDALTRCKAPLLLDGGAIRIVADAGTCATKRIRMRTEAGLATAMTPHGGEAATLADAVGVGVPARDAGHEEMAGYAKRLADAYASHILLKGPVSFVASPSGWPHADEVLLMDQGSAALAKAGTGDVLAGMCAALMAQGVEPSIALMTAATVHATAGRLAEAELGIVSVCAEDVLSQIPFAIKSIS